MLSQYNPTVTIYLGFLDIKYANIPPKNGAI